MTYLHFFKSDWFPLTFDRPSDKQFPEKPLNIPLKGYRDAFFFSTAWKGKKAAKNLCAAAYRSGTGTSVGLSISSVDTTCSWDMNVANPSDLKWYYGNDLSPHERSMKGFVRIHGPQVWSEEQLLLSNVEPRTCGSRGQGSREWFLDRGFSGTSSTIFALIQALAPQVLNSNEEDEDLVKNFKTVLDFCGYLPDEIDDNTDMPELGVPAGISDSGTPNQGQLSTAASAEASNQLSSRTSTQALVPPASVPPASVPPASVPLASVLPASIPPASVPPASAHPASVPPASAPQASALSNQGPTQGATQGATQRSTQRLARVSNQASNQTAISDNSSDIAAVATVDPAVAAAKQWIDTLSEPLPDDEAAASDDQFMTQMESGAIDDDILFRMISILKASPHRPSTRVQYKKKLADWLSAEREHRPFHLLLHKQLHDLAKKKKLSGISNVNKSTLISILAKNAKKERENGNESDGEERLTLEPLICFLDASFLQPQKDKIDRDAAAIGHDNEEHFIKQFVDCCDSEIDDDDSEYSFSAFGKVSSVYRPGLVRHKTIPFAKASADGVVFQRKVRRLNFLFFLFYFLMLLFSSLFFSYLQGWETSLIPVEVKSRVSFRTENETLEALKLHVGDACPSIFHKKFFFKMESDNPAPLHKLLQTTEGKRKRHQSECIQLLHHVFVYGATTGLFLIGNNSKLLFSIEVAFSGGLLSAYEEVVKYLYKQFDFFYEKSLEDFPIKKIEQALILRNEKKKKKNAKISVHAFWTNFKLWRALNVHIGRLKFPLPPCRRIIPIQHSWWNITKGPSDTTTKLLDNCEENLGVRTPQTIATARMLGIAGVVFHRCNQIIGSKESSFYKSLDSYRKAANTRAPFWQSLVTICEHLWKDEDALSNPVRDPLMDRTPPPRKGRPRTRSAAAVQPAAWMSQWKSGFTPKRGRRSKKARLDAVSHDLRQQQCLGVVLVARVKRGICKMCRMKTQFFCTGCKNFLCIQTGQDCSSKIELMKKNGTVLENEVPAPFLEISARDKQTNSKTNFRIRNSCYHIAHAQQFGEYFKNVNEDENVNNRHSTG